MAKYTSVQLAELRRVIASGVINAQYSDHGVTYRGQDELLKLERLMVEDLEGSREDRFSVAAFSRE